MKLICHIILLFLFVAGAVDAQEINTRFGKNRVQYSDDFDTWYRYETQNFITYWYGKGRNVAISSIQLAEYDFDEIQNILEHRMNEKIELIVYGDISELFQTNIGLESEDPVNVETVQLIGTKLYVHFDGNHNHLRESIREGIAKVYIYSMLYGSNFQELVQNSFMSEMPEWFKEGILAYTKNRWTPQDDSQLRYLLKEKKRPYKNFKKLSRQEPLVAGKAFWYYIGENYGISSISNIIYLTKINRSVKSAFNYVLGEDYDVVADNFMTYYLDRYTEEVDLLAKVNKDEAFAKNSYGSKYLNLTLSPDGSSLAYVKNKNGRYSIILQDTKTGKKTKIKSAGYNNPYRITDENFPILFWSPDSKKIAYIYDKKDELQLRIRDIETKETYKNSLNPIFNRIYSAAFEDDDNLIFSGNTEGYSDLYRYNLNTRIQKNITKDFYDDLDANVTTLNGVKGIIFSSNRDKKDLTPEAIDTTLAIKTFDIYFLPLDGTNNAIRLTKSVYANEFHGSITDDQLSFITDKYGVQTLVQQKVQPNYRLTKTIESLQLTSNITDAACNSGTCFYSTSYNNREYLIQTTLEKKTPIFTKYQQEVLNDIQVGPFESLEEDVPQVDDLENIPEGWFFQTEFGESTIPDELDLLEEEKRKEASANKIVRFDPTRSTADRLRFKILNMSSNLDNEPLFGGLNSYAGNQQNGYEQAPLGLLLKMKVGDAFEDYIYEGGIRFATNFSGYEAFITYEDRKHKWDHLYGMYYRSRSNRRIDQFDLIERNKDNTYIGYYQAKYPFDEFQSVRFSGTLRSDRDYTLITNESSFNKPVTNSQRIGARAEYVYDNSSQRSINIFHGSRSKFFVEGLNKFRLQVADPFIIEPSNGFMTILGLDSRYYLPVFEKSVLAARISAGTTLGNERTLFYVGGVERAILGGFDQSTGIPNEPFAYENIAPQLRGFDRNIRNGTSYLVTTVELRVPVVRHLFGDQIRYDFLRELQLVGFFDSGTAWHGLSPYSDKNPINSATFESGESVILDVQYFRDPLVLGYGWGFRTLIFGYFIKVDFARGVETRSVLAEKIHISLGTDF